MVHDLDEAGRVSRLTPFRRSSHAPSSLSSRPRAGTPSAVPVRRLVPPSLSWFPLGLRQRAKDVNQGRFFFLGRRSFRTLDLPEPPDADSGLLRDLLLLGIEHDPLKFVRTDGHGFSLAAPGEITQQSSWGNPQVIESGRKIELPVSVTR